MSGQPLSNANFRRMNGLHRLLLWLSRGRIGGRIAGMTIVELHTVGRISGRARSTILSSPVQDRDSVVLVASKGGSHGHPDWYLNLVATPDVELTIDVVRRPFRARTVPAGEKAALWPRITAAYPGYGAYQRRTDREIPVVVCDRVA